MVETQAKVISVSEQAVTVTAQRSTACGGCQSSEACGTSSLSKLFVRNTVELTVPNSHPVEVGDEVVLGLSETAFIKQLLVVYFPPLTMMMLAAGLVAQMSESQSLQVLSGFAGLLLGFALTRILKSKIMVIGDEPRIIRKLGDAVYE